jgi:hypothetical protein
VLAIGAAWCNHEAAHRWLMHGGRQTTDEERRVALVSFDGPVAELLSLGAIDSRASDWPDYVARHALNEEHVPELIRMASTEALHELDEDDPAVWAPIHAMRALGQLRATTATRVLIDVGRAHQDDDWMELPGVFELIGPAAIPALQAWLRDDDAELFGRVNAVECLWHIGRAWPASRASIVADFTTLLLSHQRHDPTINGFVVYGLIELGATDRAELIREACEAGDVDSTVTGGWSEIQQLLEQVSPSP